MSSFVLHGINLTHPGQASLSAPHSMSAIVSLRRLLERMRLPGFHSIPYALTTLNSSSGHNSLIDVSDAALDFSSLTGFSYDMATADVVVAW